MALPWSDSKTLEHIREWATDGVTYYCNPTQCKFCLVGKKFGHNLRTCPRNDKEVFNTLIDELLFDISVEKALRK